jgi:hypothetical protein
MRLDVCEKLQSSDTRLKYQAFQLFDTDFGRKFIHSHKDRFLDVLGLTTDPSLVIDAQISIQPNKSSQLTLDEPMIEFMNLNRGDILRVLDGMCGIRSQDCIDAPVLVHP